MKESMQNDSSPARQLFVEFLQDHLGIEFRGFQSAFGHGSDLILFQGPHGSTLAVPADTMHEPRQMPRGFTNRRRLCAG